MITAADKVKAIQDAGYRVYVSHRRPVRAGDGVPTTSAWLTARQAAEGGWIVLQNGGETTVEVHARFDEKSVRVAAGRADCSVLDRFEKRTGLELAVRRAIAGAPELRAVIGQLAKERGMS